MQSILLLWLYLWTAYHLSAPERVGMLQVPQCHLGEPRRRAFSLTLPALWNSRRSGSLAFYTPLKTWLCSRGCAPVHWISLSCNDLWMWVWFGLSSTLSFVAFILVGYFCFLFSKCQLPRVGWPQQLIK